MDQLSGTEVTQVLLTGAVLLGSARLCGELARRWHQPAVLGEIIAGILLGPTVLGALAPGVAGYLFPASGPGAQVLSGITNVALVLFMLVAGMEVDLSAVWRQGRSAVAVSLSGLLLPFAAGFGLAWASPRILGAEPGADPLVFALFFATALAISALPVIVRTLLDLDLFRSDLGMVVVPAAIVNDVIGWVTFAFVIGMADARHAETPLLVTLLGTVAFFVLMLTVVRWALDFLLPRLHAFASWPGGVLGFTATFGLLAAALTEWLGVHAVFGAFVFGVAIGDSRHLRERTRATLDQFVSFVFAPLFFATVGLRVNLLRHFDPALVAVVLAVAVVGKVAGGTLGARLSGIAPRQAWAIGVALTSRGAMEIILGLLALRLGIIGERLFVALVVMALVTSVLTGPILAWLLRSKKPRRCLDFVVARAFLPGLVADTKEDVIRALSAAVAEAHGLDAARVEAAVLERERLMSTGLEKGVAVPHARLEGLTGPVVGVATCDRGVEFDAVDGEPCRIVVMVLTPASDDQAQLEILADVARTLSRGSVQRHVLAARTFVELRAAVLTAEPRGHDPRSSLA